MAADSLDEGVGFAILGRLGDGTGGFVDDQDVRIFVENVEAFLQGLAAGAVGVVSHQGGRLDVEAELLHAFPPQVDLSSAHGLLGRSAG